MNTGNTKIQHFTTFRGEQYWGLPVILDMPNIEMVKKVAKAISKETDEKVRAIFNGKTVIFKNGSEEF